MSDAPARRDDLLVFAAVLAVSLGTVALTAFLPAAKPVVPSTPAFADRDPTCAEWTDGCITCQRTPQGPACSTPGIACVRETLQCLRREGSGAPAGTRL